MYEEDLLNHIKNKVLCNFRKELKTYIKSQFQESCHETSWQKQSNDDAIALLKEEIEHLIGELMEKNKVISNLIGSCKILSSCLQDNLSPCLAVDASRGAET